MWKVESFLRSVSVIFQHSEPYSSTEITQLLYSSLSSLFLGYTAVTLLSMLNAFLALPSNIDATKFSRTDNSSK